MKKWQSPEWNVSYKAYLGLSLLLFVAAFPLPYGFYIFTKIIVFGFCITSAYQNFNISYNQPAWSWFFLFVAVLFNPFIAMPMGKELWIIIDITLSMLFLLLAYKTKNPNSKEKQWMES